MPAINPNEYAYLWSPTRQMLDKNGKPLVGGYVMLDQHGTPGVEALSYSDWNGTLNARRILLDSLGRASAIVENDKTYDMYVYNRFNVLTWSALGVNCAGEGGGDPLRFTSSDGSVIITRTSNVVDLKVHQDEKIFGSVEADSVDSNGLIEFDTVGSGDITVVSSGSIRIGLGKLYHITVALEFNTNTATPEYHICSLVDSENTTHNFSLDGSRTTQLVELSWDAVSTSDIFRLYIQAPSEFSVTSAELYIHAVNPVVGGSAPQMQSDWDVTDVDSPAFIKNKPDLSVYARLADLAAVAFSGDYDDLTGKPDLSVFARSADLSSVAFSGSYNDLGNIPANLVQDPNYVHTDENFTAAEKTKLASVESGAEVNVNADWNATSGDAEILNKPENLVQDPNYVHTDNNFTNADKSKLAGIEAGAEVNVQADWSQSDSSADDYIKNKPTIYDPTFVATYNSTTYADLKAAMDAKQQILLKTSAAATPIVPEMWGYGAGAARVVVLEYSADSITRKTYSVTTQNVWSSASEVIHANVDEVLTVTYNTISADTTGKMGSYYQDGKTIFLKIGSSVPYKWLPLYSLASGVYSFRDIQPTQDGKKLQAVDYQWNGNAWSTTTTDLLELKPGTVVLTTSSTTADIEAAIADGAVPLLFIGNATGGVYYQMVVRRVVSTSYCYVFMRDPTEVGSNGSSDYCYVLSNSSSWNPYPDTSGSWAVHNEVYLKSDWDQIDSDSPDYIKNKPNQSPIAAGTDITLTEVNGTLLINSTAVPAHTAAESTKILSVDSNGNLVWVSPQSSSQVQSDWNQTDSSAVDYIKNKPSIPVIGTITL